MIYAYVRVSNKEQNQEAQIKAITDYCAKNNLKIDEENILIHNELDKDFDESSYKTFKSKILKSGDALVINNLGELASDMESIKEEWNTLLEKGVDIVVTDTKMVSTFNKSDSEKALITALVADLLSYMADREKLQEEERKDAAKVQATATTIVPLSEEKIIELREALSKSLGKEVFLTNEVDTTIVGGGFIKVGDKIMDGTIKGRLERLQKQMS